MRKRRNSHLIRFVSTSLGLSDPFVKIKYGELKKKSEIIQRTITPKWNQAFEFPVFSNDVRELLIGCFGMRRRR